MLRVRYFGDLHVECTLMQPAFLPPIGEDLVVLAGDIAEGIDGVRWAIDAFRGRPVVYVLGNHEFFGNDFDTLIDEARSICENSNVHVLENEAFQIGGYRVLGCTLWTDFRLYGERFASAAVKHARERMPDYRLIRRSGRRLAVRDTIERCRKSITWLADQLASYRTSTLVVTHHAPSLVTGNPRFAGGSLADGRIGNAAYHSNFDALIKPPVRAWIHGHTHHSVTELVGAARALRSHALDRLEFDRSIAFDVNTRST